MESVIIDREILPEPIFSFIHSEKIKIFEENGNIILAPVKRKPDVNDLFGMFNDGKLSSEDFIKQKAVEKEMENSIIGRRTRWGKCKENNSRRC